MAGNERIAQHGQIAFEDVQVGAADAASPHAQPKLVRLEWRLCRLFNGQNDSFDAPPVRRRTAAFI